MKYGHKLCERLNIKELANKLEIRFMSIAYMRGNLKIIKLVPDLLFSETAPTIVRQMNRERYHISNHKVIINCMKGIEKAHPEFYLKLVNELNCRFSKKGINQLMLPDYLNVLTTIKQ